MKYPVQLRTKVSAEDARQITHSAELAGLSVCAFLRERAAGRPVKSTVEMRTLLELRRIGGLVKLLHSHSNGNHQDAARIARGLDSIRRTIEQAQAGGNRT